ncbi:hypothetical protein AMTRI_Chr07g80930 [Amborella trichopoda]|uniref:Fe2OG dioxygenase domain-containing protein n=1 Tax=Amborella trichopoda TaxID=13333 RepID=W1NHS6_AMBTC|nr:gibberellin 20-oxidase-like protein [Amborella trichopoda]ERM95036.1 hypothetical protein AMTR_s00009p00242710 [Amborella trichopoda]|eukprot:XP_006827620.1 gibberellin 20-oxidase-like protein [Amborella trichopoda]
MAGPQTCLQLPVLDISEPLAPPSLSQACQDWGFFYISNHGISLDLIARISSLSKNLFNVPSSSKQLLGPNSTLKTYTPHFIVSPFFESLRVWGPDFAASAMSSSSVLLGEPELALCEVLQEYGTKMVQLSKRIMEVLLRCLGDGLDYEHLQHDFQNSHGYLRINNYTAPNNQEENEGLGIHTDMSCITILHQNEIGGLQVRCKEGNWLDISPNEGNLVINIGDLLQAWSNGRFKSSHHRVVLRGSNPRLSLAFFWCFEDEKVIYAPDKVLGERNFRLYRPFLCKDYLRFREEASDKVGYESIGWTVMDFAGIQASKTKN